MIFIAVYKPRMRSFLIVITVLALVMLLFSNIAVAQPQGRDEAEQEVSELQQKVENAVEKYNYASYKLNETKTAIADNSVALGEAQARLEYSKSRLNNRARAMYVTRHSSFLDVLMNAQSFDEFLVGVEYSKKVASNDADLLKQVKEAETNLRGVQQTLAQQEQEREAAIAELSASRDAVEKELSGAKGRLAGIEDEVRQAMDERVNDPVTTVSNPSKPRSNPANPVAPGPPPGEPNTGVVGVAYNQLGDPYVYGAAGPDSFDCSGLVMYCYAHGAGISLPHSSYAQAGCGTSVSISQLQPGDIVGFRGWGHVGIYVGGGEYIHAPQSGDVVKVSSLSSRGDYAGAVRP